MATSTVEYSAEYLAESKAVLLNTFYSIPIPLEILSTAFRLWAKVHRPKRSRLAFDDYFVIWATVRNHQYFAHSIITNQDGRWLPSPSAVLALFMERHTASGGIEQPSWTTN